MGQSWFKHDYGARNDDNILELRAEYGWKGYGLFYAFIETMAENGKGAIDLDKIGGLSIGYNLPKDELLAFVDKCLEIGLFYKDDDGLIRNNRITIHVERLQSFREAGKKGAKKRWSNDSNRGGNGEATDTPMQSRVDKSRVDKKKTLLSDLRSDDFDRKGDKSDKIDWTTVRFHERVRERYGHHKNVKQAKLEDWRDPIRLMNEQDGLEFEDIWSYIKFLFQDDFWKDTVKSTSGLRNNWEEIDSSFRRNGKNGNSEEPKIDWGL